MVPHQKVLLFKKIMSAELNNVLGTSFVYFLVQVPCVIVDQEQRAHGLINSSGPFTLEFIYDGSIRIQHSLF